MSDSGYIVYIDEAGDFGLKSIVPINQNGASEWFILGAAVVRRENEHNVPKWLNSIRYDARNMQPDSLHFRGLNDRQKRIICEGTATFPIRLFTVISNKRNMRRHKNQSASHISGHRHWFYWWMTRLLMERVTDFCAAVNVQNKTPGRTLQIEFSMRKDLKRDQFTDYFTRLWAQGNKAFLKRRLVDWTVFDFKNIHFRDHRSRAGLQFADIVASAFYQAVNIHPQGVCRADYAKLLSPRIHRLPGAQSAFNEGFTVWPASLIGCELTEDQKEIFRHFNYPERRLTK